MLKLVLVADRMDLIVRCPAMPAQPPTPFPADYIVTTPDDFGARMELLIRETN